MSETPHNPMIAAVAYAIEAELVGPPTLDELYDRYMDLLEEQIEAECALPAASTTLHAMPEWVAFDQAVQTSMEAKAAAERALAAVKSATLAAFQETGDKQPHPYAGIHRVDTRAVYREYIALQWVERHPDYQQLIKPATLDRRGFEKLVRALEESGFGAFLTYDDAGIDVPLVEWEQVPVVSVKIREEA